MRSLVGAMLALVLVACSTTTQVTRSQSAPQTATLDAPVEFLLTSAATDFHAHRPPYPSRFRNIRIGYVATPDGTRQYMLCGAFLSSEGGNSQWTPFVTIKTSGYEQLLGNTDYCGRPSVVWIDGDFSSALQSRLDSTR